MKNISNTTVVVSATLLKEKPIEVIKSLSETGFTSIILLDDFTSDEEKEEKREIFTLLAFLDPYLKNNEIKIENIVSPLDKAFGLGQAYHKIWLPIKSVLDDPASAIKGAKGQVEGEKTFWQNVNAIANKTDTIISEISNDDTKNLLILAGQVIAKLGNIANHKVHASGVEFKFWENPSYDEYLLALNIANRLIEEKEINPLIFNRDKLISSATAASTEQLLNDKTSSDIVLINAQIADANRKIDDRIKKINVDNFSVFSTKQFTFAYDRKGLDLFNLAKDSLKQEAKTKGSGRVIFIGKLSENNDPQIAYLNAEQASSTSLLNQQIDALSEKQQALLAKVNSNQSTSVEFEEIRNILKGILNLCQSKALLPLSREQQKLGLLFQQYAFLAQRVNNCSEKDLKELENYFLDSAATNGFAIYGYSKDPTQNTFLSPKVAGCQDKIYESIVRTYQSHPDKISGFADADPNIFLSFLRLYTKSDLVKPKGDTVIKKFFIDEKIPIVARFEIFKKVTEEELSDYKEKLTILNTFLTHTTNILLTQKEDGADLTQLISLFADLAKLTKTTQESKAQEKTSLITKETEKEQAEQLQRGSKTVIEVHIKSTLSNQYFPLDLKFKFLKDLQEKNVLTADQLSHILRSHLKSMLIKGGSVEEFINVFILLRQINSDLAAGFIIKNLFEEFSKKTQAIESIYSFLVELLNPASKAFENISVKQQQDILSKSLAIITEKAIFKPEKKDATAEGKAYYHGLLKLQNIDPMLVRQLPLVFLRLGDITAILAFIEDVLATNLGESKSKINLFGANYEQWEIKDCLVAIFDSMIFSFEEAKLKVGESTNANTQRIEVLAKKIPVAFKSLYQLDAKTALEKATEFLKSPKIIFTEKIPLLLDAYSISLIEQGTQFSLSDKLNLFKELNDLYSKENPHLKREKPKGKTELPVLKHPYSDKWQELRECFLEILKPCYVGNMTKINAVLLEVLQSKNNNIIDFAAHSFSAEVNHKANFLETLTGIKISEKENTESYLDRVAQALKPEGNAPLLNPDKKLDGGDGSGKKRWGLFKKPLTNTEKGGGKAGRDTTQTPKETVRPPNPTPR